MWSNITNPDSFMSRLHVMTNEMYHHFIAKIVKKKIDARECTVHLKYFYAD